MIEIILMKGVILAGIVARDCWKLVSEQTLPCGYTYRVFWEKVEYRRRFF